ncbi:hypothetical protein ACFFQW_02875 [Umezawaea endophytica]|uniref:Condensation domain-containing protein n=1 Tax=Umezawaea endophytica TaxID=1654476 RepID=A0A9X3AI52_9PSEU|nr:hypothetical protein [Umezawaea endophytica]MCS7482041.1 hypothetical protein [Umezawaea endophytica]
MITESTVQAEFHGGRSRVGPLTWGQQGTWDGIHEWLPQVKPFFVLTRWLPVPLLLSVGDVLEQISELLLRHESLRTLFHASPRGDATQEVLASGALDVAVFDRPADDPVDFTDIVTDCLVRAGATAFDHDQELPIRISLALHEGIPVLVVLGVSHMAADHTGTELLVAELTAMLQARADGKPVPAPKPSVQPVDLATRQNSPDGQLLNVEAMRHLREHVARMPPPEPARAVPLEPRFVRGEIESGTLPVAVRAAARRLRTTTSVVLLSITTGLLHHLCTGPVYRLDVMQSNRLDPDLFAAVTTLNQAVKTVVDLDAADFDEVLRRSAATMVAAKRHARYDGRLAAEVLRDVHLPPGCQVNDMWSTLPRARTTSTAETTVAWPERTAHEDMALYLDTGGTPDRMRLSLMADTALLPPDGIRAFLFAFEALAEELATGDVRLERFGEVFAGVPVD